MERRTDIEIFVQGCRLEDVLQWATARLGELSEPEVFDDVTIYQSARGPLIVTPAIEDGPFMSLWFNSPSTPWNTDVGCARDAVRALRCTVRCVPGREFPEVPPQSDAFLELVGQVERLIEWE